MHRGIFHVGGANLRAKSWAALLHYPHIHFLSFYIFLPQISKNIIVYINSQYFVNLIMILRAMLSLQGCAPHLGRRFLLRALVQ